MLEKGQSCKGSKAQSETRGAKLRPKTLSLCDFDPLPLLKKTDWTCSADASSVWFGSALAVVVSAAAVNAF